MEQIGYIHIEVEMAEAYNPLDYENLAGSVVRALLEATPTTLPPAENFTGSGVYALYYTGTLPFYSHIASPDLHEPIYVGKAVPTGARKGSRSTNSGASTELHQRLNDHAKSVKQAENLDLIEFQTRYLVVMPVWVSLAERFLVDYFRPIWNTMIDGFGNHPSGRGRRGMRRPRWDVVHPGRPWATELQAAETVEDIIRVLDTGAP